MSRVPPVPVARPSPARRFGRLALSTLATFGVLATASAADPVPAATAPAAPAVPTPPVAPAPGGALSLPEFIPIPPPPPEPAAAPTRTGGPGYLPPIMHITTDPLMPQKYRSTPAGKYTCSVKIELDASGKVTDVVAVSCDQESLWALSAAILAWQFEPALQDGKPVASELPYTTQFEVKTLLPRKHVVGFIGLVASAGGEGIASIDGRAHLGETVSVSGGVGVDQNQRCAINTPVCPYFDSYQSVNPTFHGDVAVSSPRQYFEHRGIYGGVVGFYDDPAGQVGLYAAFRGELMTPLPGLSVGGDVGVGTVWGPVGADTSLGFFPKFGQQPFYPWLRASVIWYAPLPRDQFVVVPRHDDPVVYEAAVEQDEPPALDTSHVFDGVPAVHWSRIPVAGGNNPVAGPGFANYPPGQYTCNVRVLVGDDGNPKQVRVEKCPAAGVDVAAATVKTWRWLPRPGQGDVQAVFPAPIYVDQNEAEQVKVDHVTMGTGEKSATPIAAAKTPKVWVHELYTPVFSNGVTPAGECLVDVDLDATGAVLATRWRSGDIDVKLRVMEALSAWKFYAVAVEGELQPVRVTLSMCGYPQLTTQQELDAAKPASSRPQ